MNVVKIICRFMRDLTALLGVIVTIWQLSQSNGEQQKVSPVKKNALIGTVALADPVHRTAAPSQPLIMSAPLEMIMPSSRPITSPVPIVFEEIHSGKNYFAKDGYYLKVDGALNIIPSEINSGDELAQVTVMSKNKIVKERQMKSGDTMELTDSGSVYRISLLSVGKAGKNPFTKAAFFRVEKAQ
jgi:hypothetical protein